MAATTTQVLGIIDALLGTEHFGDGTQVIVRTYEGTQEECNGPLNIAAILEERPEPHFSTVKHVRRGDAQDLRWTGETGPLPARALKFASNGFHDNELVEMIERDGVETVSVGFWPIGFNQARRDGNAHGKRDTMCEAALERIRTCPEMGSHAFRNGVTIYRPLGAYGTYRIDIHINVA